MCWRGLLACGLEGVGSVHQNVLLNSNVPTTRLGLPWLRQAQLTCTEMLSLIFMLSKAKQDQGRQANILPRSKCIFSYKLIRYIYQFYNETLVLGSFQK